MKFSREDIISKVWLTKGILCLFSDGRSLMCDHLFLNSAVGANECPFTSLLFVVCRYHHVNPISPHDCFQVKCNVTHYHLPPNKGRTDHLNIILPSCLRWHLGGLLVGASLSFFSGITSWNVLESVSGSLGLHPLPGSDATVCRNKEIKTQETFVWTSLTKIAALCQPGIIHKVTRLMFDLFIFYFMTAKPPQMKLMKMLLVTRLSDSATKKIIWQWNAGYTQNWVANPSDSSEPDFVFVFQTPFHLLPNHCLSVCSNRLQLWVTANHVDLWLEWGVSATMNKYSDVNR